MPDVDYDTPRSPLIISLSPYRTTCGRTWKQDNLEGTRRQWEEFWEEKGEDRQKVCSVVISECAQTIYP